MPTPSKVIDLAPEDKPPAHRANGRPPKPQNYYTPKMTKFMDAIKKSAPIATACEAAGFSEMTYYRWVGYADEGREPYVSFIRDVKAERARQEIEWLQEIKGASKGDIWNPRAWLLERTRPERYALKTYDPAKGAAQLLGSIADIIRMVKENTKQPQMLDITTSANVHYDNVDITEAEFKALPGKSVKLITKKSKGAP